MSGKRHKPDQPAAAVRTPVRRQAAPAGAPTASARGSLSPSAAADVKRQPDLTQLTAEQARAALAGEIVRWRNARGWRRTELAQRSGVSDAHLHRIERGRVAPRADQLIELLAALEVSPGVFGRLLGVGVIGRTPGLSAHARLALAGLGAAAIAGDPGDVLDRMAEHPPRGALVPLQKLLAHFGGDRAAAERWWQALLPVERSSVSGRRRASRWAVLPTGRMVGDALPQKRGRASAAVTPEAWRQFLRLRVAGYSLFRAYRRTSYLARRFGWRWISRTTATTRIAGLAADHPGWLNGGSRP